MVKKAFKTIFIFCLCLGISLPANAGNTKVSDGSVFITKAEFSSKLNDLSNRLSIVENSIDSKINSLVSSYLTRNGIWNGSGQTVQNNLGTTPSSSETMQVFNNISKSGLMLVEYYVDIDYAIGVYAVSDNSNAESRRKAMGSPVSHLISINVGLYNDSTSNYYQKIDLLYSLTGEYDTGSTNIYRAELKTKPSGIFCFFVKNGDNISYSLSTSVDLRMDWWSMHTSLTGNNVTPTGDSVVTNSGSKKGGWCADSSYVIKFGLNKSDIEVW